MDTAKEDLPKAEPVPPSERYEDRGLLGVGATSEVRRVYDRVLERELAMKVLRADRVELSSRFLEEARLTAGLQHPAIVAVHDVGTRVDGRSWFTMPIIHGTPLRQCISAVHSASQTAWEAVDGWTLQRLVASLLTVSQAVNYAHSKGVTHRDLKPSNVMVGAYGEVCVVDWGIASRERTESASGTPSFMAPEQAQGVSESPCDVYSMGAILYSMLCGASPYVGGPARQLADLASGPPPFVGSRTSLVLPTALVEVCSSAMSRQSSARPTAAAMTSLLQSWLDGQRDREHADELVEQAATLGDQIREMRQRVATLRARANRGLSRLAPHQAEKEKATWWELEDDATLLEDEADRLEAKHLASLHQALRHDGDNAGAHGLLADHHARALVLAEASGDRRAAGSSEVLLHQHARGTYTALLAGRGVVHLNVSPPASVRVFEYVERRRRLHRVERQSLGQGRSEVELPKGSYLFEFYAPRHHLVRHPVMVERGKATKVSLRLPAADEVGPGECFVPASWTTLGGDVDAPDALEAQEMWVPAFVMRRFPVTVREYLEFLRCGMNEGDPDRVAKHGPRERAGADDERLLVDPAARTMLSDAQGVVSALDWPITLVSFADAEAFARWKAEVDGLPWRLPHDLEWEKAARGGDQRRYPWGNQLDPSWVAMQQSWDGPPHRSPVDTFPVDVSPYGVRGLGGNVRDWCANNYTRLGPELDDGKLDPLNCGGKGVVAGYRLGRGGAWSSTASFCRSSGRLAGRDGDRLSSTGFRLARSFPDVEESS